MLAPRTASWPFFVVAIAHLCACAGRESRVARRASAMLEIGRQLDSDYERRVEALITEGDGFAGEDISTTSLRGYSAITIRKLLDALASASFYSRGAQPRVDRHQLVFDEAASRGLTTNDDAMDMFQALLAAREIERARALKTRFPGAGLWDLPVIVDSGVHASPYRVFEIPASSTTAVVKSLPMYAGAKIVVSSWYSCPISKRVLGYILSDEGMSRAMGERGVILTGRFEPAGVLWRNAEFPPARAYIAYSESDWPGIDFAASPWFHFMRDGKIVHKFLGADTREGFEADFRRGLELSGAAP